MGAGRGGVEHDLDVGEAGQGDQAVYPIGGGRHAETLGDPLNALAWLAEASIARGDPLRAGEIVLSGALGPMKPLTPGDYRIEIEGFPALVVRAVP
jgi:2-keto-4-pentenoate hydratase